MFDHFLCFIQRPVVHGPCLAETHAADTQLGDKHYSGFKKMCIDFSERGVIIGIYRK